MGLGFLDPSQGVGSPKVVSPWFHCVSDSVTSDSSPPASSVPGVLQARILDWVAIPFSRGSSWLRDQTLRSSALQALNPGLLPYRQILYHLNHQEKLNVLSKQKMKLRLKDPTASLFETCREHNIIIISVERYLELVTLTYAVQKWQADLNGGPEIKSLKIPEKSLETEQCCHQRGAEGVVNRRVYCLEIIIVCSYKFGRFLVQLYNYTYIWRIEMNYVLCM